MDDPTWTFRDQLKTARIYLEACDKTAYVSLPYLGNPITYMIEQLDELEALYKKEKRNRKNGRP